MGRRRSLGFRPCKRCHEPKFGEVLPEFYWDPQHQCTVQETDRPVIFISAVVLRPYIGRTNLPIHTLLVSTPQVQ